MFTIVFNDSTKLNVAESPVWDSISAKGIFVPSVVVKLDEKDFPSIENVKAYFNDEKKTSVMKIVENVEGNDTVVETIEGMTKIQRVVNEDGVVIVYMVKEDTIPEMINNLSKEVAAAANQIKSTGDAVEATNTEVAAVKEAVEEVKASLPTVKTREDMTLDEYKEFVVAQSKVNLATWLETTTVTSDVHGESAEYSITATKQQQLTAMIFLAQTNEEFQPSWNAAGKACTYDWTLEQLLQLAFEIQAVVRPQVSKQQSMEEEIMAATSKDAVDKVVITF